MKNELTVAALSAWCAEKRIAASISRDGGIYVAGVNGAVSSVELGEMVARYAEPVPSGGALGTQVGGSHYKSMAIQPMEYSMANKLDACQHTAIKYISRFRDKGGVQDLLKAKHVIDMLIEFESQAGAANENGGNAQAHG